MIKAIGPSDLGRPECVPTELMIEVQDASVAPARAAISGGRDANVAPMNPPHTLCRSSRPSTGVEHPPRVLQAIADQNGIARPVEYWVTEQRAHCQVVLSNERGLSPPKRRDEPYPGFAGPKGTDRPRHSPASNTFRANPCDAHSFV